MRRALFLLLIVLAPAARAQEGPGSQPGAVFAAALTFMAPRILDPVPVQQLTLWGLHGLTAIDPSLAPVLNGGEVQLRQGERVVFSRPAPAAEDAAGWGRVAGQMAEAAAASSATLRRAGDPGVITAFFDELFNHLDPYSRYVPPDDAVEDKARRSGTVGIGVELTDRRGGVFIRSVLADGPGAEAELRGGDQILQVDGQDVGASRASAVSGLLAGPEGSTVTLIVRGRDGTEEEVDVTRATLPPETVFARRVGEALVVRITGFSRDTGDRLARELRRGLGSVSSRSNRVRGVILDLRGNRGGLLRQAAEAVSHLLDTGIIVVTSGRDPQANHRFEADGGDLSGSRPVVVVVDGRSASAAEIMAAALADNRRAVVVGSSTLGKGLVQTITPLPDGGELFVTWSRVLAPLGWPIQGLGVLPQLCTSLGRGEAERQMQSLSRGLMEMAAPLRRERSARAPVPPAEALELRAPCPATEGREDDLLAAQFLIAHPEAYAAALLPPFATARAP